LKKDAHQKDGLDGEFDEWCSAVRKKQIRDRAATRWFSEDESDGDWWREHKPKEKDAKQ
jgi:hypothetical protein